MAEEVERPVCNKVTVLTIGDPHFKVSNPRETEEMHIKIMELVKNRKPDHIVILGDTLDRHESIHVSPQTRAVKFIYDLARNAPVTLLIGNHDLKNNQQFLSDEHPFYSLRESKLPIQVVDTACKFKVGEFEFVAAPYVPNGRFREALSSLEDWSSVTAIFAHQEFAGSQMGAVVSVEGDVWSEHDPHVISGHIHDYQELPGVTYVGTPIQHNFDDSNEKTVSLWTWKSDSTSEHEKISLGCRRKKIVRLTAEEVTVYVAPDNTDLKIKVSGTSAQIATSLKHPNVKSLRAQGHKVVPGTTIIIDAVNQDSPKEKTVGQGFTQSLLSEVMIYQPQYPRLQYWFDQISLRK